jgi:hypothetical protein
VNELSETSIKMTVDQVLALCLNSSDLLGALLFRVRSGAEGRAMT